MSESVNEQFNPAIRNFEKLKQDLGGEIKVRRIGSGEKEANLEQVFEQSLLGDRLSGYKLDEDKLSPYEKKLRTKKDLKINTIVDFDGVLVSPIHFQRRVGIKNMLWLARVAKASDKTVIWTNRLQPEEGMLSNYGWFPFLGKRVSRRITETLKTQGDQRNVQVKKKKLDGNGESLVGLTEGSDLTIFIGSGNIDRKIVSEYISRGGDPKKLIYFDTGHLIL